MQLTFVYSLQYLSIADPFTLSNEIAISKDQDFINDFENGSEIGTVAGSQRFNILKSFPYAAIQLNINDVDQVDVPKKAIAESKDTYNKLYNFVDSLWFIKDCSVILGDACEVGLSEKLSYTSIRPNMTALSNAKGNYETLHFNLDEIRDSTKIINKLIELIYTTEKTPLKVEEPKFEEVAGGSVIGVLKSPISVSHHNDFCRFRKAWLAIHNARTTAIIQFKVANYITSLECLFTTTNTELKHRVSERVALFIGTNGKEKREIYKQIADAYDVRSSYVHGTKINNTLQRNIKDISSDIDSIVRRAFVKIILEKSEHFLTEDSINSHFRDLIFPV